VLLDPLVALAEPDVTEALDDFVVAADPLAEVAVPEELPVAPAEEASVVLAAAVDAAEEAEEVDAEPVPLETSTAAVPPDALLAQNPAPTVIEESKTPTRPASQQKPFPWLFLYKFQDGSAQDGAPSTAPMQVVLVGQHAAATAWLAATQFIEDGQ